LGKKRERVDGVERGISLPQVDKIRVRARAEARTVSCAADVDQAIGFDDAGGTLEEQGVGEGEHRGTFAAMPMPIDKTAVSVKIACFRIKRAARVRSRRASSIHTNDRVARCSSFVCSTPPNARRAARRAAAGVKPRRT